METVRWGIIGCGDVTEVKSGPAFALVEGSELVAVMRRDGAKAEDYARRHGVPRWYDDADRLIGDPLVDAVYVATPPSSHAEFTIRAALAGKPVYVEKPMALSYAQCLKMIDACQAAEVPLFVAYYRRRLPLFVRAKELLDAGAIGPPRAVSITLMQPPPRIGGDPAGMPWRLRPETSGGGLFFDLGSHMLDIADFLLGPIASADGEATNQGDLYQAEDSVSAALRFHSEVVGTGLWCFSSGEGEQEDRIEITGTKGRLSFPVFGEPVLTVRPAGGPVGGHRAAGGDGAAAADEAVEETVGARRLTFENPPHVQQPLIRSVVDQIRGRGACPSTGESAARTARVMDQVVKGWRARI